MSDADDAVGRIIDVVDLVADKNDLDADAALIDALSRVRKRGDGDE